MPRKAAGLSSGVAGPMMEPPMCAKNVSPKVQMVCRRCGSDDVRLDALAEWDAEDQKWVLSSVYDSAYCVDCDDETKLNEAAYEPEPLDVVSEVEKAELADAL